MFGKETQAAGKLQGTECDNPIAYRESAVSSLRAQAESLRRKATDLEVLANSIGHLEGSAESALWSILMNQR